MDLTHKNKLKELQTVISKIPLQACCAAVLPEFGVRWREVSRAVRGARLAMSAASVARVLCRHVASDLPVEEVDEILARLKLKLVATQTRTWHVITLSEQYTTESVPEIMEALPARIEDALTKGKSRSMRPEVQTVLMGFMMYISVRMVSERKPGPILYAAVPPGEPVALFSSLGMTSLMKACVEGLGFKKYEDASLHGHDIPSLLRIADRAWNGNADCLTDTPEYAPTPVITANGIDFTHKAYNEQYVDTIIGPNPPLLTELTIQTAKPFFDRSILDKHISMRVLLKSDDVAKTLKSWVTKGALAPTSEFLQIFHSVKSNRINYNNEDSE